MFDLIGIEERFKVVLTVALFVLLVISSVCLSYCLWDWQIQRSARKAIETYVMKNPKHYIAPENYTWELVESGKLEGSYVAVKTCSSGGDGVCVK